jgi:membrane associated rhomboid family serine protease
MTQLLVNVVVVYFYYTYIICVVSNSSDVSNVTIEAHLDALSFSRVYFVHLRKTLDLCIN